MNNAIREVLQHSLQQMERKLWLSKTSVHTSSDNNRAIQRSLAYRIAAVKRALETNRCD